MTSTSGNKETYFLQLDACAFHLLSLSVCYSAKYVHFGPKKLPSSNNQWEKKRSRCGGYRYTGTIHREVFPCGALSERLVSINKVIMREKGMEHISSLARTLKDGIDKIRSI